MAKHLAGALVAYHDVVDMAVQEAPTSAAGSGDQSPPHRHATSRRTPLIRSLQAGWGVVAIPFWIVAARIVAGVVLAHLVLVLLPQASQHLSGGILSNSRWLGAFDRYDSRYYLFIAQHGYPAHLAAIPNHTFTAFFPGYSLLVAVAHGVTFGTVGYLTCGIVVSWLAFAGAAILLYRLAERRFSTRVALIATVLFCWFPTSLFFLSPYSEALFAFEILLVLTCLERGWYLAAALVAGYASATSPESLALTVAVVVAVALGTRNVVKVVVYGALSGFGIGAYMLFLHARFGHFFEFIDVQKYWVRAGTLPFVGLYRNVQALEHYITGSGTARPNPLAPTYANLKWVWILNDAALVLATVVMLGMIAMATARWRSRRTPVVALPNEAAVIPWPYLIVGLVIVLIAACTTISPYALPQYASSEGEARFVSVIMPLYLGGALLIRRWASLISLSIGGFVVLALLFQALYNLGYWVT